MAEFKFDSKALIPSEVSPCHAGRPSGGLAQEPAISENPDPRSPGRRPRGLTADASRMSRLGPAQYRGGERVSPARRPLLLPPPTQAQLVN